MTSRLYCVILVAMLFPSIGLAQDESVLAKPPTLESLAAEIRALQQQVSAQRKDVAAPAKPAQPATLESLADDVAELRKVVGEQHELIAAIADVRDEKPFLALRRNWDKSKDFRSQMRDVVNESLQREGTLRVTNYMASDQNLLVNGRMYTIPQGRYMNIPVPVGTVGTKLPGQELINWTVAAPNYFQGIEITPRRETVWSPTYVVPPLTPVYYYP